MWKHTSLSLLLGCFACGGEEPVLELDAPTDRDLATLALVNDPNVTVEELDHGVELDARAAQGIVEHRPFSTIDEVDAVPYVGPVSLEKLYRYAIEHGYLKSYRSPEIIEIPDRSDVLFDEVVLRAAMMEARITDADAVLTRAKVRFDDGDLVLDSGELSAAAFSCRDDLYAIDGYRYAESVVASIMEAFELEDRLALLAAGVAHDEDANRYLTQRELERARLDLTRAAQE